MADRMFPIMNGPDIPWSLIAPCDAQAKKNHGGQDLEHLASRGGLSVHEALHVLKREAWGRFSKESGRIEAMSLKEAQDELAALCSPPNPTTDDQGTALMTDDQIAANLREAAGKLNHFLHVAKHHGLFVHLTAMEPEGVAPGRISDVFVARPILPAAVSDTGATNG